MDMDINLVIQSEGQQISLLRQVGVSLHSQQGGGGEGERKGGEILGPLRREEEDISESLQGR